MSQSGTLGQIQAAISGRAAEIQEKIERLKQAKGKIETEQNECTGEIKQILKPELGTSWVGNRAEKFQNSRKAAYTEMETIISDKYSEYIRSIESKIRFLEAELAAVQYASGVAQEVGRLISRGETFIDQVNEGIASLKGWIN